VVDHYCWRILASTKKKSIIRTKMGMVDASDVMMMILDVDVVVVF
jgi:hypothetical protein